MGGRLPGRPVDWIERHLTDTGYDKERLSEHILGWHGQIIGEDQDRTDVLRAIHRKIHTGRYEK